MAPVVEFRTGVDDPVAYAARWLRVAAGRGARARVTGAETTLQAIDRALWVEDPQDFVPHAWAREAGLPPGLARTPIWLGDGRVPDPPPVLLLNVGGPVADDLSGYERVIEIVSNDQDDAQAGRQRWKAYQQRGLSPGHRKAEA
jgi:DNA polymerase-3 subunit chi